MLSSAISTLLLLLKLSSVTKSDEPGQQHPQQGFQNLTNRPVNRDVEKANITENGLFFAKQKRANDPMLYHFDWENVTEMTRLKLWYCTLMREEIKTKTALTNLEKLACRTRLKHYSIGLSKACGPQTMCQAYTAADAFYKGGKTCVPELFLAECYALTMYTHDFGYSFNCNTLKGYYKPFQFFTALLTSAVKKLSAAATYRLPPRKYQYFVLSRKFIFPSPTSFHFRQFVTLTTDKNRALSEAGQTVLEFITDIPASHRINLNKFHLFQGYNEVLLSPFERVLKINPMIGRVGNKVSLSIDLYAVQDIYKMTDKDCKAVRGTHGDAPFTGSPDETDICADYRKRGYATASEDNATKAIDKGADDDESDTCEVFKSRTPLPPSKDGEAVSGAFRWTVGIALKILAVVFSVLPMNTC